MSSYNQLFSSIGKMIDTSHKSLSTKFPHTFKAMYAVNHAIFQDFPASVAKAVYIDSPIYSMYEATMSKAIYSSSIAGISYEIRSQVKTYVMDHGEDKYVAGITAGMIGGSFRYYILNQNPVIGALNNIAYETCSNIELCNDNPYVNIPFTIIVETLDASLHAAEKAAKGDMLGAALNAVYGGAKIGAFVCTNIYTLYIPAIEYAGDVESAVESLQPAIEELTIAEFSGDTCPVESFYEI